jgi:hypothetical protein
VGNQPGSELQNNIDEGAPSGPPNTVGKLARAAALAALLVPLGSIAGEAASINCSFAPGSGAVSCSSSGGTGSAFGSSAAYFFNGGADTPGGYQFELFFDQVNGAFDVEVSDQQISQAAAASLLVGEFSNHICIPIADGLSQCVIFQVSAPAPGPTTWVGFYDAYISWFYDTNGQYGDNPPGSVHMLQAEGNADGVFDDDITTVYCANGFSSPPNCSFPSEDSVSTFSVDDPGVGGTDNSFSGFIATHTSAVVPEPSTMLLLASGLAGGALRRRKRRNQPS